MIHGLEMLTESRTALDEEATASDATNRVVAEQESKEPERFYRYSVAKLNRDVTYGDEYWSVVGEFASLSEALDTIDSKCGRGTYTVIGHEAITTVNVYPKLETAKRVAVPTTIGVF